jgi:phosphotransferase system enzyme I (PtsI)
MLAISSEVLLQGLSIAAGIGIGPVFFLPTEKELYWGAVEVAAHPELELERFQVALEEVARDIQTLQRRSEQAATQESTALLGSQLQLLFDPILTANIKEEITQNAITAESAVRKVVNEYQKKFLEIEDLFFSERFQDVKDISERLLSSLRGASYKTFAKMPLNAIVMTEELSASHAIEAVQQGAVAFVTEHGTSHSHAAIIAKGKGIPYVAQAEISSFFHLAETTAIVNGSSGEIVLNPMPATLRRYVALSNRMQRHFTKLVEKTNWPAETYDGYVVELSANIDMLSEVTLAKRYGSSGIGLFRTEYLLLSEREYPTEEEQHKIYQKAAEEIGKDETLVIRTFDIGGDKLPRSYRFREERNSLLGCRAIRFLLQEKELFRAQLRAIIRANVLGNIDLLLPMVATVDELLTAKAIIREITEELKAAPIRVGCMVEVPSAALIADLLAKECDFVSIGTNDLIQYSLAVDRENCIVRDLYSPAHPSVLRLIKHIAEEAVRHKIPVAICGEIAADPRYTPILLAFGINQLSVAPWHLPKVKKAIRDTSIVAACQLTEHIMTLANPSEIESILEAEYQRRV